MPVASPPQNYRMSPTMWDHSVTCYATQLLVREDAIVVQRCDSTFLAHPCATNAKEDCMDAICSPYGRKI